MITDHCASLGCAWFRPRHDGRKARAAQALRARRRSAIWAFTCVRTELSAGGRTEEGMTVAAGCCQRPRLPYPRGVFDGALANFLLGDQAAGLGSQPGRRGRIGSATCGRAKLSPAPGRRREALSSARRSRERNGSPRNTRLHQTIQGAGCAHIEVQQHDHPTTMTVSAHSPHKEIVRETLRAKLTLRLAVTVGHSLLSLLRRPSSGSEHHGAAP